MHTRCSIAAALLLASTLGACGSSSHKAASSSSASAPPASAPPAIPANAPPAVRAVAGRVLLAGDIPHLAPQGQRTIGISARTWVQEEQLPPSEQAGETLRLQRLGFIRGVRERLIAAGETGPEGLSVAIQFGSPRAALANAEHEARSGEAHGAKPFAVAGIPGARGFGGANGATTGYNVAFAKGAFYYLVGVGYATGAPAAPTREQLTVAAQRLYSRVH